LGRRHDLYPALGYLASFYNVARNVGSHHRGLAWEPATNEVVLPDRKKTLRLHVHEFQQRYRYLAVYLCDYGMRGILSAFCKREQGSVSEMLLSEYEKIFRDAATV
jgi:hypothetical protein